MVYWFYGLFPLDSRSCYECMSQKSMDDCNSKMIKTTCPSGYTQCVEITLTCREGVNVTRKVFMKGCMASHSGHSDGCDTRDYVPSCPTPSGRWSKYEANCCYRDNCNSGMSTTPASGMSPTPGSGTSHSINRVMLGICMALIFWALAFTH